MNSVKERILFLHFLQPINIHSLHLLNIFVGDDSFTDEALSWDRFRDDKSRLIRSADVIGFVELCNEGRCDDEECDDEDDGEVVAVSNGDAGCWPRWEYKKVFIYIWELYIM